MMKFKNVGLNYANCTARCRPNAFHGTVVRKSSYDVNNNPPKVGTEHSSEPCPNVVNPLTSPWGGRSARKAREQLLATRSPHHYSARFASTDVSSGNLYEILGVSPKATHKEIKAAYYDLSMTYHPDKNRNCEVAAHKFREITAAYEVLGNFLNRKKYDRGIITHGGGGATMDREVDGVGSYQTPRGMHYRSQVSVHMGRSTIYNFDEWTKAHYGDTRAKRAFQRAQYYELKKRELDFEGEKNVELMMVMIAFAVLAFTYSAMNVSYDRPLPITQKSDVLQSETDEAEVMGR